jgi:ribosomal protein S27E
MTDVVDLKARRQAIEDAKPVYCYTCPRKHQTFVLRPDARVECGSCGTIQPQLIWGQYFVSTKGVETGPLPESSP